VMVYHDFERSRYAADVGDEQHDAVTPLED
jgi:hypothetical protein